MRKISLPAELGWARAGTFYDIAPLELYYLRATILEGSSHPKRASRNVYLLCVQGSFEVDIKGKTVKVEQGDILEVRQGDEYVCTARSRALAVVLEP